MTSADIITLDGIEQRADSFRFEVLDKDLHVIGEVEVETTGVSVENNINRDIKRQLNDVTIPLSDTNEINVLTDRLRPRMTLQDNSEWPLGTFVFSDTSFVPMTGTLGFSTGTLLDQGIILDQPTNRAYSFKPGTNISLAITRLLDSSPINQYSVESTTSAVKSFVSWPPGTKLLEIINDLCELAGFYTLFFDNDGVARVISVPDLSAVDAELRYGSVEPDEQRVLTGTITETNDLLSAPNRYIVINSSLTDKAIVGFWDIPSTSPNSKENRGFVVATTVDKQGIDTNDEATAAAKAYGQADYNTFSWATFDAAPDPRHDTFNIVAWEGVNYREQSWTLTLGGFMKHELRRIYNEPTFVEII